MKNYAALTISLALKLKYMVLQERDLYCCTTLVIIYIAI